MPRTEPRSRWAVNAVGAGLAATLVGAWLAFAGVHHPTRAALHLALALVLAVGLVWPPRTLALAGRTLGAAGAGGWLLLAGAIALVPLPRAALAWVAPAVVEARPTSPAWTLALDPEAAVGDLCDLLLPLGALVAATAWGSAWWRRRGLSAALRAAFVGIGVIGAAHALSGSTLLFGAVPASVQPPSRFFAPFVDPNHLGTALVLCSPPVLAAALDERRRRSERIGWGAVALGGALLAAWIRSSGVLVAGAAVALLCAAWIARLPPRRVAAVALGGAVLVVGWLALGDPQSAVTFTDRLATWQRGLAVLPGYWLAGAGGGTFEAAQLPLHTAYNGWAHAHSDYVEWIVEHGLIGVVAAGLAIRALWPSPSPWPRRAALLSIGVAGVAVHALVDFPFQIPFLAMGAAGAWGLRRGAYEPRIEVRPGQVRFALASFALLELAASGWELRTTAVERAAALVRADPAAAPPPDAWLWRMAPTRPEPQLLAAWQAEQGGDRAGAAVIARAVVADHPDRPDALRAAASILARAGDPLADEAFTRAELRYPGDWRTWVAHARIAPPEDALAAWTAAFDHGAPAQFLRDAYAALPVGLAWLAVGERRDARFVAALAVLLQQAGDAETALLAYEQARQMAPSEPPAPGYVGLLVASGRIDEARALLTAALADHPDDDGLRLQEARFADATAEPARAADLYLALAERRPELLVDAMRAREAAEGDRAGIALLDRWEQARAAPAVALLERARLYREVGELAQCALEVERSGLADDTRYGPRARQLARACDAITPTGTR